MKTQNVISSIKGQYGLLSYNASLKEFMFRSMFWVANAFCLFFCNHLVSMFERIFGYFFRCNEENFGSNGSVCNSTGGKAEDQLRDNVWEVLDSYFFGERENFVSDSGEENRGKEEGYGDELGMVSNASTKKYQFLAGNSLSRRIEEPQTASFKVQELFVDSEYQFLNKEYEVSGEKSQELADNSSEFSIDNDDQVVDSDSSAESHLGMTGLEAKDVDHGEKTLVSISRSTGEEALEKEEEQEESSVQHDSSEKEDGLIMELSPLMDEFSYEAESSSQNHVASYDTKRRSISSKADLVCKNHDFRSNCIDSFLGDNEFGDEFGFSPESHLLFHDKQGSVSPDDNFLGRSHEFSSDCKDSFVKHEFCDEGGFSSDNHLVSHGTKQPSISSTDNFFGAHHEFSLYCEDIVSNECGSAVLEPKPPMGIDEKRVDFGEDSPRSVEGTEKEEDLQNFIVNDEGDVSGHESDDTENIDNDEDSALDGTKSMGFSKKCDEFRKEEMSSLSSDADDEVGCDILLQHKELVQQMKKEMRSLKIKGLPTILEESESPRMVEDLNPLKIDGKIEHKDRMEEIQKIYKSYADKMRKMDILSHQTMYAVGFLHLKNQDQLASKRKASTPVVKSLLSQNFLPYNLRRHEADPVQKLMTELQRDLELAYVAQLCLSWEILKWQYDKAVELQEFKSNCLHQYNLPAGEFEQFKVLVQRFTEDEPFQGPRIQNYLKSRCVLNNLLQVPPVKADPKNGRKGGGDFAVSIKRLAGIIEESMRTFWKFLHTDKDEANIMLKMIHGSQVVLQNPSDMKLLTDIQANLQKKERRLKDLIRRGTCIVKKLQKHQDYRLNHGLFVAQVELRLVSRVLSMSRFTTDQLQWCHRKLSMVNLVGREVQLDSSFLLFPC
ncbi:hypothetical protein Ancab_020713 [Ancistrocladus abbreviatus]